MDDSSSSKSWGDSDIFFRLSSCVYQWTGWMWDAREKSQDDSKVSGSNNFKRELPVTTIRKTIEDSSCVLLLLLGCFYFVLFRDRAMVVVKTRSSKFRTC